MLFVCGQELAIYRASYQMQEELRFSQQQWCHEDSVVETQSLAGAPSRAAVEGVP